jgi:glucosamine-6-phosphate deaminase
MTSPLVKIFELATEASLEVAHGVVQTLGRLPSGQNPVLGLATGATPLELYREWVRMHLELGLDWRGIQTFNLDEYWPMPAADPQSFRNFMEQNLWGPAEFDAACVHIPSGEIEGDQAETHCAAYENSIRAVGGIQIQLLGIGRNGHLGFNEPGTAIDTRTRMVRLAEDTRDRAAASFAPKEVPEFGISMGLATIFEAQTIYLMAFGADKAEAVARALQGPIELGCPASLLRTHGDVRWVLDAAAASRL